MCKVKCTEANRFGLQQDVYDSIIQAAQVSNITKLILFGSRACGDYHDRSAVDLLCYTEDLETLNGFRDSIDEIRTLLIFNIIDAKSDMISLNLYKSALEQGIVIYDNRGV